MNNGTGKGKVQYFLSSKATLRSWTNSRSKMFPLTQSTLQKSASFSTVRLLAVLGSLEQMKTDLPSVRERLVSEGLIQVGRDPLTLGVDHYATAFIELTMNGVPELRSDADDIGVLLNGGVAKKLEAFSRIYKKEIPFVESLLHAGMKLPNNQPRFEFAADKSICRF